jgi:hypothetical protein
MSRAIFGKICDIMCSFNDKFLGVVVKYYRRRKNNYKQNIEVIIYNG